MSWSRLSFSSREYFVPIDRIGDSYRFGSAEVIGARLGASAGTKMRQSEHVEDEVPDSDFKGLRLRRRARHRPHLSTPDILHLADCLSIST